MLVVKHLRYRQMPSLVPRQGDVAKHLIVSLNMAPGIKIYTRGLFISSAYAASTTGLGWLLLVSQDCYSSFG